MQRPPFAGGPLWELAFRDSTEVGACFTFWSVAQMAGHHRRVNNGVRKGNLSYRDRARVVHVGQNPEGVIGSWALRLTEHVRVPTPGRRGEAFPPSVRHELEVRPFTPLGVDTKDRERLVAESPREEIFLRPPLLVHVPDRFGRVPTVETARPTEMLDHDWSTGMRELARYATWLAIAQQTLIRQHIQSAAAS